ncbi:MAG TPA: serine/threonine-protein kinase [Polyangiaceae bacterium]|jgi:serine/threonine protein kinase
MSTQQNFFPVFEEQLPREFGRYTLLSKLATGGMAEVFVAMQRSDLGMEKLVALKRLLPALSRETKFIEMFVSEARTAATLTHPNIAQVFDVGELEGAYFIAMEYIEGADLRTLRRVRRAKGRPTFVPLAHSLHFITQVLAGLEYAHEKKDIQGEPLDIVHRDISPQNLLVDFSGNLKIVDFGIAKSAVQLGEETKIGELKGKIAYMSPEQARGENIDSRTDVFATAVVLFELTSGKRLFSGSNEVELLEKVYASEYPRPSSVRPGYPEELEAIVMRGLSQDRERRYQSAREMLLDLRRFVDNAQLGRPEHDIADWVRRELKETREEQEQALAESGMVAARAGSISDRPPRNSISDSPPPISTRPPPNDSFGDRRTPLSSIYDRITPRSSVSDKLALQSLSEVRPSHTPFSGPPPPHVSSEFLNPKSQSVAPEDQESGFRTQVGSSHTIRPLPAAPRRSRLPFAFAAIAILAAAATFADRWVPASAGRTAELSKVRNARAAAAHWVEVRADSLRDWSLAQFSRKPPTLPASALVLDIAPPQASVWLNGQELKKRRLEVSPGRTYHLTASAPGYTSKTMTFSPTKDVEKVRVELVPLDGATPGAASTGQ